jgi:hypothetical protein
MRVRLQNEAYAVDFVGFMRRCRCQVVDQGAGIYAVFFAPGLTVQLSRPELRAYLAIWEYTTPGARATLLDAPGLAEELQ